MTRPPDRLEPLFHAALALPPEQRASYLDEHCAGDAKLRATLDALLAADGAPTHPGLAPPLEQGPPSLHRLLHEGQGGEASGERSGAGEDADRASHEDRYQLQEEVGRGGMGRVWRARDRELGREVALKFLRPEFQQDGAALRRFVSEARVGGRLQHPGVVPVYDLGVHDGQIYFAMKLVDGRSMADLLAESEAKGADRRRLLGVFHQLTQALAFAHSSGVVHRDLKPANVMVGRFGEVQVADWGMARVLADGQADEQADELPQASVPGGPGHSTPGTVFGTPAYMPPEQARGEVDRLNARADVFALGAVLCEILSGGPAWTGDTEQALERARAGECEEIWRRLEACGADPALAALCRHCLQPSPEQRPRDAGEVAEVVGAYLEEVERRAEQSRLEVAVQTERAQSAVRVQRLSAALGLSVLAVFLVGGAAWWWLDRERGRQRDELHADFDLAWSVALDRVSAAEAEPQQPAGWDSAGVAVDGLRLLVDDERLGPRRREQAQQLARRLEGGATRAEQARERLEREDRLLTRLEEIPIPAAASVLALPQNRVAEAGRRADDYRQAFADFGLRLDEVEAAAQTFAAHPRIHSAAIAFDEWADSAEQAELPDELAQVRAFADAVDPDPWRQRLRAAGASADEAARLLALRGEIDLRREPVSTGLLLAERLRRAGELEAGIEVLEQTREAYPQDFHAVLRLALFAEAARPPRVELARRAYAIARALRPGNSMADYRLGVIAMFAGDMPAAQQSFARVCALEPEFFEAAINLAGVMTAQRRSEDALEVMQPWLEQGLEVAELHANRASCLLDLGRVDEALQALDVVERSKPDLPQLHTIRAGCWIEQGRFTEAHAALRRSLQLRPDHGQTLSQMVKVARQLGQWDEAEAAADRLRALYPERAGGWVRRAEIAEQRGQPEAAAGWWREAQRIEPAHTEFLLAAAANLGQAGRREEAELVLLELLGLQPGHLGAAYQRAALLADRGLALAAVEQLAPCLDARAPDAIRQPARDLAEHLQEQAERQRGLREIADDADGALPEECLAAADLCWREGARSVASRLYLQALDEDESAVELEPTVPHLLQAAKAMLAQAAQGAMTLEVQVDEATCERALDWLELDLDLWEQGLREAGPRDIGPRGWWSEAGLAPLREPAALRRLSPELRERARRLWDRVDQVAEEL